MEFSDMIGYAATVVGVAVMLPQLYKTYTTKHAEDLSWGTLVLIFVNCILWLVYGVLLKSQPLIAANGIGLIVVTVIISLKMRYRASI